MARVFARLKLRLLRNGLRESQRAVMFAVSVVAAVILVPIGFGMLAGNRGDPARAADDAVVFFGVITLLWTFLPVLSFSSDETLDPQRLVLLPLDSRQLVRGLLVAALIGVAPIAVTIALCGAFAGLAHDPVQAILIAAAIVGTALLGAVSSRTLVALLAPLLRSRRGRDAIVALVAIGILLPQLLRLLNPGGSLGSHAVARAARIGRFVPFALGGTAAGEAGRGHLLASVAALAGLAVLIALLLGAWQATLARTLTNSDAVPPPVRRKAGVARRLPLFPRVLSFLPRDRVGAVAAKDLRYLARDPRRRGALISALVYPVLIVANTVTQHGSRSPRITLLALVAVFAGSQITLNQFGLDGDPLWVQVGAGNDPRADLTGKNLAILIMTVPLIAIVSIPLAAISGGWAYVPLTIGLAPAAVALTLAIGNVTSVRMPFGIADRRNPFAANSGRGCAAIVVFMFALLAEMVLATPIGVVVVIALSVLPLAVATLVAIAAASAYGAGLWLLGRRLAANYAYWRLPEILAAVSSKRAN